MELSKECHMSDINKICLHRMNMKVNQINEGNGISRMAFAPKIIRYGEGVHIQDMEFKKS